MRVMAPGMRPARTSTRPAGPVDVRTRARSAPEITGRTVANPGDQRCSAATTLGHLRQGAAAADLVAGFETTLAAGVRTRDLGGAATATEFTAACCSGARPPVAATTGRQES